MVKNFIIADDVREAKQKGHLVQIVCCNCRQKYEIHISIIEEHIKEKTNLSGCRYCDTKTELHPEAILEVKSILKIQN